MQRLVFFLAVVATAALTVPALAAPESWSCTFNGRTMVEELRREANEIVIDLDTQMLEMHAPDGNWTYENNPGLGLGLSVGAADGSVFGGGIAEGRPFAFRSLPGQKPGHRASFTWTELRADSRVDESVWLCD